MAEAGPGTIAVQRHRGATILVMRGDHDASTAEAVRDAIASALIEGPVIIDLTDVAFIDSTIIGTFVANFGPAESGTIWKLAIVLPPSGMVLRVLHLVAIERIVPVYFTVAEATRAAASARGSVDPR